MLGELVREQSLHRRACLAIAAAARAIGFLFFAHRPSWSRPFAGLRYVRSFSLVCGSSRRCQRRSRGHAVLNFLRGRKSELSRSVTKPMQMGAATPGVPCKSKDVCTRKFNAPQKFETRLSCCIATLSPRIRSLARLRLLLLLQVLQLVELDFFAEVVQLLAAECETARATAQKKRRSSRRPR